jgi:hypothetical protein
MRYKSNPEFYNNLTYDEFLNQTIKAVKKIEDPLSVNIDQFAKKIKLIDDKQIVKVDDNQRKAIL